MAMNAQKTRWMLLGWLGRAEQLTRLAAFTTYSREDEHRCTWIQAYLTNAQQKKLMSAVNLISEVLAEIRKDSDNGTDKGNKK